MAKLSAKVFSGMDVVMARSGLAGSIADVSIASRFDKAARKPAPVLFGFTAPEQPEHGLN